MKKALLIFVLINISISFVLDTQASTNTHLILLTGSIGDYPIEMEITSSDFDQSKFDGRYRYLSQKNYLNLQGTISGNCFYIEEFYNESQTGSFYLQLESDTLKGYWVMGKKVFNVELVEKEGEINLLLAKTPEEYSKEVSNSIIGTYQVGECFINDFFATDENPIYEIGWNGGSIVFEDAGDGNLKFNLEFICGPTYHMAFAEGIAKKEGDIYVYTDNIYDDEECRITFKFGEKTVYALANKGFQCGFGARAYVDHELIKIKD
jgi:hypothetical protein